MLPSCLPVLECSGTSPTQICNGVEIAEVIPGSFSNYLVPAGASSFRLSFRVDW
jgi:hypothetical protein